MTNNPFDLSNATIKTANHVLVTRQAPRPGLACTYWKIFQAKGLAAADYWTNRENKLIAGLWSKDVKRVVKLHNLTNEARPNSSPMTEQIATFDAGLSLDHWLQLKPHYRNGQVLAHPFQALSVLLDLAWACLDALKSIHEKGYVHLDLRADNICLPYEPYPYPADNPPPIKPNFARLALIDFAFSISPDLPLQHPLPMLPTGKGQSERLRQALEKDRAGRGVPPFAVDCLDWRCDLVSLGHMLEDIARKGVLVNVGDNDSQAWLALQGLVERLKNYDRDKSLPETAPDQPLPNKLPHEDLMRSIDRYWQDSADDDRYDEFRLAYAPTPPPLPPTPVPVVPCARWHWKQIVSAAVLTSGAWLALAWSIAPYSNTHGSPDVARQSPGTGTGTKTTSRALLPTMQRIEAGSFEMGCGEHEKECDSDESPRHTVTLPAFELGVYEVTFAEWDACEAAKACRPHADDKAWGRGQRSVINVSWNDAQTYIAWLNKETGQQYRLPSEAEWEYAARAGTKETYWWGNNASHDYANYGKDECCAGLAKGRDEWLYTAPVGSFPQNPWHVYDMHGNVWEWVEDCYHDSYNNNPPKDGSARDGGTNCADSRRVLRGGSWINYPRDLRSASRNWGDTGYRDDGIGFRLARTLTP